METSNIEHRTSNIEPLTAERLAEFRGDVESLKRREQRFAQMLVTDFEALLAAAEETERLRQAVQTTQAWGKRYQARLAALEAENERLNSRIDALTEYLRHGPNCPADVANLKPDAPNVCDCGLKELLQTRPDVPTMDTRVPELESRVQKLYDERAELNETCRRLLPILRADPPTPEDKQ